MCTAGATRGTHEELRLYDMVEASTLDLDVQADEYVVRLVEPIMSLETL